MKIEKISLLSQRFFKVTFLYLPKKWVTHGHWGWTDTDSDECVRWALFELDHTVVSKGTFHFRLFWILFWLFGIIYTGYAVYQDTNHYLDYPSMILRKEESLGKFNDYTQCTLKLRPVKLLFVIFGRLRVWVSILSLFSQKRHVYK